MAIMLFFLLMREKLVEEAASGGEAGEAVVYEPFKRAHKRALS